MHILVKKGNTISHPNPTPSQPIRNMKHGLEFNMVTPIKIFGCDRGGEFMSHEFTEHLEKSGTVHHLTVHDSPASNSVEEQENRTLIEGTHALLHTSGLPQYLWAEVHHHFIWL